MAATGRVQHPEYLGFRGLEEILRCRERPRMAGTGGLLAEERHRRLKPLAGGGKAERLAVCLALGPDDQGVRELAGIDADHGGGRLGALAPGKEIMGALRVRGA
ncbi:MAG: hypothetical protein IPL76_00090 [Gemmatimonadetes bacterium]|nr:hypothetical protein [Gemmatimonadota bacterium]